MKKQLILLVLTLFGTTRSVVVSMVSSASETPCSNLNENSVSKATQQNFISAGNKFAFDMYKAERNVPGSSGNIFFSPASISLALGLALAGAKEETLQQIKAAAVGNGVQDSEMNLAFALLNSGLSAGKKYELDSVNAMYAQKSGFQLNPSYSAVVAQCFKSVVELRDFTKNYEQIRQEINKFVEKQTKDKIQELLKKEDVGQTTRLILVNAIYFKGEWEDPFTTRNSARTLNDSLFFPYVGASANEAKKVALMNKIHNFLYSGADPEFKVLGIPYKDEELTMYLFLPKYKKLQDLEMSFSAQKMEELISQSSNQKVEVFVPKFKITENFPLKDVLMSLGIKDMFNSFTADFSGINGNKGMGVYFSKAIHKAFIEVNEKGTEAAAATGLVAPLMSGPDGSSGRLIPKFKADHPFLFAIKHHSTGAVLFLGSLYDV